MLKQIIACILCIIACKATVLAQEREALVEIEGSITAAGSGDPVPYVHIMNPNSGYGTVSNTEGRFWIKMNPTDTILFSAIGFETYAFMLRPDQNARRLRVEIEMNLSTQVLKPVNVFAYRDEESLKQALLELDPGPDPEEEKLVIPGVRQIPMQLNPSISMSGPISFFYNKFSRKAKLEKKLKKDIESYDYRNAIKAKYNEQVVSKLTGLPEDEVEKFMEFCRIEEAFIAGASEYDIALAVSNCLKKYHLEDKEE